MVISELAVGAGVIAALGSIKSLPPMQRGIEYTANVLYKNRRFDPAELLEQYHRGLISDDQFVHEMNFHGFKPERSMQLITTTTNLLSANEVLTLWRRGKIEIDEFQRRMLQLRFSHADINNFIDANEVLPGPSDMVRFAVREVFTPEIIEKFRLMEDLPQEFLTQALKVGLSEETATRFWLAHWELPSIQQGFEMLHRLDPETELYPGEIPDEVAFTTDTMRTLLRTQDVGPYWRERFMRISRNLPTRVDIRRMYHDGHLTEEQVYKYYLKLGYDEFSADKLTQLAKTFYKEQEREITRSLIVKGYHLGELTEEQATEALQELGYQPDDAEFIIAIEKANDEHKDSDEKIKVLSDGFVSGVLDEDAFRNKLTGMNLLGEKIELLIDKARIRRAAKLKLPSKADVEEFLKKGLIDVGVAQEYLLQLGYRSADVELYLAAWTEQV